MDVGCILDYGLRLWAPTFVSRAISAVAGFLFILPTFPYFKATKICAISGLFLVKF